MTETAAAPGAAMTSETSLRTVEFRPDGQRTTVVLSHEGLPDAGSRDRHAQGWAACMDIFRERGFAAAT